jgi:outer membrane PBP1 activator LpoA protein
MKKVFLTLTIAGVALVFASCGNDAPKTDLNAQEQAAVDSTVVSDEASSDSLEAAIKAQIGTDMDSTYSEESHEGHDHAGHSH